MKHARVALLFIWLIQLGPEAMKLYVLLAEQNLLSQAQGFSMRTLADSDLGPISIV